MTDECIELKNIKYKTMLLSPHTEAIKTQENIDNLDELIKKDKINSEKLPWSKLNKTMKISKINDFVINYSKENKMNEKEKEDLQKLLQDSLNKKLLQKAKDVVYDKSDCGLGCLISIRCTDRYCSYSYEILVHRTHREGMPNNDRIEELLWFDALQFEIQ